MLEYDPPQDLSAAEMGLCVMVVLAGAFVFVMLAPIFANLFFRWADWVDKHL